eukprot:TRINITY_DN5691_c0_g1_i2.p1 TRINITY_DN5691_c0_g1~~TRINITY_DN5691_c0_g1_i2.p1  ORF type:complete len:302 (+),score=68.54 TRINITY_DN5691_c0_g1_i2:103-1008(+)
MERSEAVRSRRGGARAEGGEVDVGVPVLPAPRAGLRRHAGAAWDGASTALDPLLFLQLLFELRCLPALGAFVLALYAPLFAAGRVGASGVAVLDDPRVRGYFAMHLVSTPLAYVWHHRMSTLAHESSSKATGGGRMGWRAYLHSGRYAAVQADGAMLCCVLAAGYALQHAAAALLPGEAGWGLESATLVIEAIALAYTAHSWRLERMGVNTRGLKAAFLDTHLPYFLGYALPHAALLRALYAARPAMAPALWALLAAVWCVSAAVVRPDSMGRPHTSSAILTVPHRVLAACAPGASGRGVA